MFTLYTRWDAMLYLAPEDIQFILTPDEALARAAIYYELDYSKYTRSLIPQQVPDRTQVRQHRFFATGYQRKPHHQYDRLYDDVEFQLEHGLMVGIDKWEDWSHFSNPFYFDENSNLIYDCFMDHYSDRFRIEVRDLYEYILNNHQGRKPAPTVKQHYADAPIQHAQATKTINSKAAGRLLAAGGVYNGNTEDFHNTAEQLGGDAPAGYDQIMNEQTKGTVIAAASVAAAFGLGRLSPMSEIKTLSPLSKSDVGSYFPTGRSGYPMNALGNNSPTVIGELKYSAHALDRMQGRGVPPSAIQSTINAGELFSTKAGTTGYYDSINNLRVIVNSNTGNIVTVIPGAPK